MIAPEDFVLHRSVPVGECWEWTGAVNSGGRPVASYKGAVLTVARVVLMLWKGAPLRPGMVAGHRCDNPRCVRPDHLEEISYSENLRQAYHRGRRAPHTLTASPHRKGVVCNGRPTGPRSAR